MSFVPSPCKRAGELLYFRGWRGLAGFGGVWKTCMLITVLDKYLEMNRFLINAESVEFPKSSRLATMSVISASTKPTSPFVHAGGPTLVESPREVRRKKAGEGSPKIIPAINYLTLPTRYAENYMTLQLTATAHCEGVPLLTISLLRKAC